MPTITQVRLEGFQSHVKSHFHLGQGLNVVTGPSDAGKTSIIRAIRWVAFNEPQGEAFVNEKVGEAIVTLSLDSGTIITKRRRKGKTSYLLQLSPDDEGSLYEKSEVPDEVKNLLQIDKQRFGDFETALNFAFQLDAPFLISETASAGAKILGKLAGTECIDLAIKGISKDTYAARQERLNAEKDVERISGSMLAFLGVDDQKNAVDMAEIVLEQVTASVERLDRFKDYTRLFEGAADRLDIVTKRLDTLKDVTLLEGMLQTAIDGQVRHERLLLTSGDYLRLTDRIESIERDLYRYKDVTEASEIVDGVQKGLARLERLRTLEEAMRQQQQVLKLTDHVFERTQHLPEATNAILEIDEDLRRYLSIRVLSTEHILVEGRQKSATERLERFAGLAEKGAGTIKRIDVDFKQLEFYRELHRDYEIRKSTVEIHRRNIEAAEQAIVTAVENEKATWQEAGGICPLCGQLHERGSHE
ncbi:AAA family ATPase [Exiguobacterium sp. s162]|uniref:AAA family ATPase n=1 Tax=Exiguobacterium sp. s162 TaxID=2751276 RepID=UPI001BEBBBA3|nr:AAA family ATPase [Exiguobacterium sp. s162]